MPPAQRTQVCYQKPHRPHWVAVHMSKTCGRLGKQGCQGADSNSSGRMQLASLWLGSNPLPCTVQTRGKTLVHHPRPGKAAAALSPEFRRAGSQTTVGVLLGSWQFPFLPRQLLSKVSTSTTSPQAYDSHPVLQATYNCAWSYVIGYGTRLAVRSPQSSDTLNSPIL